MQGKKRNTENDEIDKSSIEESNEASTGSGIYGNKQREKAKSSWKKNLWSE